VRETGQGTGHGIGRGVGPGSVQGSVQGTVATFDEEHQNGSLLLDDGTPLAFDRAAFLGSGLRRLRLGQRVRVERAPGGIITRVTLITD
jgi:cold shock CspA family protein